MPLDSQAKPSFVGAEPGRMTRAAMKRAAAKAALSDGQVRPAKKRVVLGELPNISNFSPLNSALRFETQRRKYETRAKAKKKAERLAVTLPTPSPLQGEKARSEVDAEADDPQMCGSYAADIFEYLHKMEMEPHRRPLPNYLEKVQTDVTANMRGILVDWLVEVAQEYKLLSDTLYLAVSYVDRFLSSQALNKQRLQLLGVSSMLIASKYEEITPPHVDDFCDITDDTYTKDQVVKMEAEVLKALKFEVGNPTIKSFLTPFIRAAQESCRNSSLQLEFLCHYLAELSLLDCNSLRFLPSLVAASVVFLAKFIARPKVYPWSASLQEHTRYKSSELKDCVLLIHDLYLSRRGGALQAIREKYKQHKFKCVATMPSPPEVPASYFEDVAR